MAGRVSAVLCCAVLCCAVEQELEGELGRAVEGLWSHMRAMTECRLNQLRFYITGGLAQLAVRVWRGGILQQSAKRLVTLPTKRYCQCRNPLRLYWEGCPMGPAWLADVEAGSQLLAGGPLWRGMQHFLLCR